MGASFSESPGPTLNHVCGSVTLRLRPIGGIVSWIPGARLGPKGVAASDVDAWVLYAEKEERQRSPARACSLPTSSASSASTVSTQVALPNSGGLVLFAGADSPTPYRSILLLLTFSPSRAVFHLFPLHIDIPLLVPLPPPSPYYLLPPPFAFSCAALSSTTLA